MNPIYQNSNCFENPDFISGQRKKVRSNSSKSFLRRKRHLFIFDSNENSGTKRFDRTNKINYYKSNQKYLYYIMFIGKILILRRKDNDPRYQLYSFNDEF